MICNALTLLLSIVLSYGVCRNNSPAPVYNDALTYVAQEVSGLLQQSHLTVKGDSNPIGTIAIRAIDPEYNIITVERLTERELEVLQLIVDGYSNIAIAGALYITVGTVKTHVHNILKKLCAEDRTQSAIRALRSGLVH